MVFRISTNRASELGVVFWNPADNAFLVAVPRCRYAAFG